MLHSLSSARESTKDNKRRKENKESMKDERRFRAVPLVAAAAFNFIVIVLVLWFVFTPRDLSDGNLESRLRVGLSFSSLRDSYLLELEQDLRGEIEERGDVAFVTDAQGDAARQLEQLENLFEQSVDVVLLNPAEVESQGAMLEVCRENGVPVIIVEGDGEAGEAAEHAVRSNDYDAGVQLGAFLQTELDGGQVLLLGIEGNLHSERRIEGFMSVMDQSEDWEVAATLDTHGLMEDAMEQVEKAMEAGTSFNVIMTATDTLAAGALAALRHNHKESLIRIVSVEGSPEGQGLVKAGKILATTALYPSLVSRYTLEYLYGESAYPDQYERVVPVSLVSNYNIGSFDTDSWE